MRASAIIAVVLSIAVAGWMLSGQLGGGGSPPAATEAGPGPPPADPPPPRVRVKRMSARSHAVAITVPGRSEAGRRVDVRAEKEVDPDISIPIIYVNLNHEGIGPEDVVGSLSLEFAVRADVLPGVLADDKVREITTGAPSTQWWTQLATAVAFGLAFATLLTLVVTPCALMVRENFRARAASR